MEYSPAGWCWHVWLIVHSEFGLFAVSLCLLPPARLPCSTILGCPLEMLGRRDKPPVGPSSLLPLGTCQMFSGFSVNTAHFLPSWPSVFRSEKSDCIRHGLMS